MILYLDTSAFVPLLVTEPTSERCGMLWDHADRLVTVRLTFVEAAAAIAMAERIERLTAEQADMARQNLAQLWPQIDVIELDEQLSIAAAQAARAHGLRGYDAVHCAAATTLLDETLVAAAGDTRLISAWGASGLAVADTNSVDE